MLLFLKNSARTQILSLCPHFASGRVFPWTGRQRFGLLAEPGETDSHQSTEAPLAQGEVRGDG